MLADRMERALRRALRSKGVRDGIGGVAVGWMRRHLSESRGADGDFLPLKRMERRRGDRTLPGRRDGGRPLLDTGAMARSLRATCSADGDGLTLSLSGLARAGWHDSGFSTAGPNYIPLSNRGQRRHATGADPAKEGLERGWDYLMAWDGVTVPARPFLAPDRDDLDELAATIFLALKAQMEG